MSAPTPFVAQIVVSDIIERLSPKYAPAIVAAPAIATFKPAPCAIATATGIIATCVPIEVPIQVDIMQVTIKIPGIRKCEGIKVKPMFTIEAFPPITEAPSEKAPAIKTIIPNNITPDFPAPSV